MTRPSRSLMQGTVDLLILRALQDSPCHGYAISRFVRERTSGVLALEDAALYQALHRLEARGLVTSDWGVSENNRRAKYYRLLPDGRARLKRESASWREYAAAIFKVLDESGRSR